MQVQVVPTGSDVPGHVLTSFVINDDLAVDAGAIATWSSVHAQARLNDILLTHSHMDHIAGLPVLLDTVYRVGGTAPRIHGSQATIEVLKHDLFNNRLMPDFVSLSQAMTPFLSLHEITPQRPTAVGRYIVTALPVKHTVPTLAYLIDDRSSAVAIITDTVPVPEVLEPLARWPRLKAVFLEASFPSTMNDLAKTTGHQTAGQFLQAARLFAPSVAMLAIHIKPRFYDQVRAEIDAANLDYVSIAEAGMVFNFAN